MTSSTGLTYTQLMGIVDGYDAARGGLPPISALQIQLLGMNVELGDIEKKVNVSARSVPGIDRNIQIQ